MKHEEYTYTRGLTDEELIDRIESTGHGVLSLANANDSYAIPLNYYYTGSRLYLRMSDEPDSMKIEYATTTDTATFVIYDYSSPRDSWSVLFRGELTPLDPASQDQFTAAEMNEYFPPFRLFDEDISDVEMKLYELHPESITGRTTLSE